ncbi:hypothetical protein FDW83_16060 [Pseudarthrobacter sp. NamE2]|nr:hypothetical protein FDW83_16060 [Pseudarthrobacter sp. NamE2]
MPAGPASGSAAPYCRLCGEPRQNKADDGGTAPPSSYSHLRCDERLQMEPPRFCAECGRRLKVQVTPFGWSSTCSRHGGTGSDAAGGENRPSKPLAYFYDA